MRAFTPPFSYAACLLLSVATDGIRVSSLRLRLRAPHAADALRVLPGSAALGGSPNPQQVGAGRSTGVVFDSGDGVSHSVPVFEGYCPPHAVQRFPLAGGDVTMELKKLLQEQGVCLRTTAEMEIVREIKEKCCCVALNYEAELKHRGPSSAEMHYTMPDGQIICLSTERFRAPEILLKPELIGRDQYGMHESVFKSILGSDIDLRRGFLGNIVLSGGNTLLPGLPERLQAEIRGMVPADLVDCVRVSIPKDRDFSVWSGGAVLAILPTMPKFVTP
ncbi:actin-like [Myripristis murdjan]|uniref:actin-like n=1 Tax=Myripristis murdjan TaxID=586833 RepID=UPI00117629A5|nr:actin-like [Myripristis murdjan]